MNLLDICKDIVETCNKQNCLLYVGEKGQLSYKGNWKGLGQELQDRIKLYRLDLIAHLLATVGKKKWIQDSLFSEEDSPSVSPNLEVTGDLDIDKNTKKLDRQMKKSSQEKQPVLHTITDKEYEILLTLRDSRRLNFVSRDSLGLWAKTNHWFVNDLVKAYASGQKAIYDVKTLERFEFTLAEYSNDPYLEHIDILFQKASLRNYFGEPNLQKEYQSDCIDELLECFPEDLYLQQGTVYVLKLDPLEGKQINHHWFVAKDGGIVDPIWKLYPNGMYCYEAYTTLNHLE